MKEPTRRLKDPVVQEDGSLIVHSFMSSTSFTIRGLAYVASRKVIPVIFVPGTMGTNLRVRREVPLPPGYPFNPGEAAWLLPNNDIRAWKFAKTWSERTPRERQLILSPEYVEVDDGGDLEIAPCSLERSVMRERGWGEIYSGAYGTLLYDLQSHLEKTFRPNALNQRVVRPRWIEVMEALKGDFPRWGVRDIEPLTETELETYAQYQYPVYACGYNWLQSCGESAKRLEQRVSDIIAWWQKRKHECTKVILVTHSMGGLVARACAKRIPDQIAGVVHGVMPAMGAPIAYRRLACGVETGSEANGAFENYKAGKFADIGGRRPEDTTPVLAVAPGALELLPNHLYPSPWLHIRVRRNTGPTGPRETLFDYLHLPNASDPNPYDLYRDMTSWYRLINPSLVDPAGLYTARNGGAARQVLSAIALAEKFHLALGDYYHPSTFAYYGDDKDYMAYGQIRWVASEPAAVNFPLTAANIRQARYLTHEPDGARTVEVEGRFILNFTIEPSDSRGDGTVPHQSASRVQGKIKQTFVTRGYLHQESYMQRDTLLLTRYCIVKIVLSAATHAQAR